MLVIVRVRVKVQVDYTPIGIGLCSECTGSRYPPYGQMQGTEQEVAEACDGQASCLGYNKVGSGAFYVHCSIMEGLCDFTGSGGAITINTAIENDTMLFPCMVKVIPDVCVCAGDCESPSEGPSEGPSDGPSEGPSAGPSEVIPASSDYTPIGIGMCSECVI